MKRKIFYFLLHNDCLLLYKDTCKNYFKVWFEEMKSVLLSATAANCEVQVLFSQTIVVASAKLSQTEPLRYKLTLES